MTNYPTIYPTITDLGGEITQVRRFINLNDKGWSAFNPSIMLSNEGEYWLAVRSSNYALLTSGSMVLTAENKIRNKLYLVRLDPDTWQFDESTLKEVDIKGLRAGIVRNIEDPRLFWDGQNYCISATFLEIDCPSPRMCKVTLKSLESAEAIKLEIYPSFTGKMEKNWMPIHRVGSQKDAEVDFIYKSDFVFSSGKITPVPAPKVARYFRGGTQVIPVGDGTSIALTHELYYRKLPILNQTNFAPYQSFRHYTHNFVLFNSNFEIVKVSKSFVFAKEGIEFASGIAEHNKNYVISFARSDLASFVVTIDKKIALSLLEDAYV